MVKMKRLENLSLLGKNSLRCQHLKMLIPFEVSLIERKNPFHTMHLHGGYQPCFVGIDTDDLILVDKYFPILKHLWTVFHENESTFESVPTSFCFVIGKSKTTPSSNGTSENHPSLSYGLTDIS